MKIQIEITKSKSRQTKKKDKENTKEKEDVVDIKKIVDAIEGKEYKKNPITEYIKHMSWKQKLIYGGIVTAVVMNALDNKEVQQPQIVQLQPSNQSVNNQSKPLDTILDAAKTEEAKADIIKPISITASDLLSKFAKAKEYEDEKALDDYYKNKYLEITGSVESVVDNKLILENDNNDKWYSEWMTVKCSIEDQQELSELSRIQLGEEVTVTGLCDGYDGLSVQMQECFIENLAESKR